MNVSLWGQTSDLISTGDQILWTVFLATCIRQSKHPVLSSHLAIPWNKSSSSGSGGGGGGSGSGNGSGSGSGSRSRSRSRSTSIIIIVIIMGRHKPSFF